jgi:hypothetical protein
MFIEFLTGADGNVFCYDDVEIELLSGDFGISATEMRSMVDYCIQIELLFIKDGFVNSISLDENLSSVYEKRNRSKEKSSKQLRVVGKFVTEISDSTVVSATEIPQSKLNKNKEEKSKVKKNIDEIIFERQEKLKSELVEYKTNNPLKYPKTLYRQFFDHYSAPVQKPKDDNFILKDELHTWSLGGRLSTWFRKDKSVFENDLISEKLSAKANQQPEKPLTKEEAAELAIKYGLKEEKV